jgi:hypothetical protein
MPVTVSYSQYGGYIGLSNGTKSWSLTGLPTDGRAVAICLQWGYTSGTITLASPALSVDGAPAEQSVERYPNAGNGGHWYFWRSCSTANQNFTIEASGSYAEGGPTIFIVGGHDAADMFGGEWFDVNGDVAVSPSSGNGLLVTVQGASHASTTLGGVGGSWSSAMNGGGYTGGSTYFNGSPNAGSNTLTASGSIDILWALELRAGTSGTKDLAGAATASAAGSGVLSLTNQLAVAAVARALGGGSLSVSKALTASAVGQAVGSAALSAFSQVWRVPTSAPNGTSAHMMILSGSSPNYFILAQGPGVVAGGYADMPATGSVGTKAFAFVHNYSDNTATTSIRGGASIATLTAI